VNDQELQAGASFLAEAGLTLFAILDCAALPAETSEAMLSAEIPLANYRRLVLIGHGGRRMWAELHTWGINTGDPIDHYSTVMTRQFIRDYLHNPPTLWLYPNTPYLVPLQQLGQLACWSHPSPLGQGIHPVYGVWFAYRAAFLTTLDLPLRTDPPQISPCESCADKPCFRACPVGAVQLNRFDVNSCAHHRLRPGSFCADRCLARLACPVFPEHRYTLPQIQYHYRHSLTVLRAWYGG
jgi:hypothetical protein